MSQIRLDKYLSDLGVGTRNEIRQLIRDGRVGVDGVLVRKPETKIDAESSRVSLDGSILHYRHHHTYIMDKPEGVITATEDGAGQTTVLDLLPPELRRLGLFPVGRLDKDTSGLLLLTDDGDLAHKIISPKSGVDKRYLAIVDGVPDEEDAEAFRRGLILGDGTVCLPARLECTGGSTCYVTVQEGKYHQVKRMLASRGIPVLRLRRLSIGGLCLDENLGPGGLRELEPDELCKVFMVR